MDVYVDVVVDLDVLLLLKKKKKMMMMMMMMMMTMTMTDNGQYEKDIKHDQTHCGSPKSWGLSGDALWVSVRLQIGKNCQSCFIHVRETILLFLTTFTTVSKTNNTVLKFPLPPRVPRFLWAFWQLPCLPSKWRRGEQEQEPQQEQAEQAKKEQDEATRTDNNSYDNDLQWQRQ